MKKRRALRLDHFGPSARTSVASWAVLAVALATAAGMAAYQRDLVQELETLEVLATRRSPVAATPAPAVAAIDVARIEDAARRADNLKLELGLPWTELFDAVEVAVDPSVALLAVEPDARRSALKVTAEARSKQAMLDYMSRLGARRPIVRVMLESHSERSSGARPPVQFTLLAYWEQRP